MRRCRPHVPEVAGEWSQPIYDILDLCDSVLFLHLVVFKYIALQLYFLVVCRSSIICSSTFESKLWVHTVVHCLLCTSPSAAYFVSTCSLSLCTRWLPMSDKCVLVAMMMQQIERYRHKFVVQRRRLRQSKPPHQRLPIRRRRKRRGRGGDHGCETPAHRNQKASKVNTAFSLAHDSSDSENESATIN